jgi:hypothetical protein
MQRYNFPTKEGEKFIIYKCLICGYAREWDDAYDDEKKAQIKSEVDKHHNEHIIPDEPTLSE